MPVVVAVTDMAGNDVDMEVEDHLAGRCAVVVAEVDAVCSRYFFDGGGKHMDGLHDTREYFFGRGDKVCVMFFWNDERMAFV